jgi:hypothetical protein
MKPVARRVRDRHMLLLIEMWLETPVEEVDERGRKQRTTRNKMKVGVRRNAQCGRPWL